MEQMFTVGLGPHKSYREHRQIIDLIYQAIDKRRTVQMRYYSASRDSTGRREDDPYRLWFAAGGLYLIAYCHLRKDVRLFAVERIRTITLTYHPYQMPLGFNVQEYVQDALNVMRGRAHRGRVDVFQTRLRLGQRQDLAPESGNQTLERRLAQTDLESGRQRRVDLVDIELWG